MTTGHDLFTLIHKGQRKELFAATVGAGTTNWEDPSAASNFVSLWAAGQRTQEHGLAVYRELTVFVAHYLLYILDDETLVMPAIWRLCTEAEINAARLNLQADQSPAGVTRSRRAVLPAITEAERTTMAHAVQRGSTTEAFTAFMSDARQVLEAPAWQRLERSLAAPHSCSDHTPSTSKQGS